jgi:hypothetical protein
LTTRNWSSSRQWNRSPAASTGAQRSRFVGDAMDMVAAAPTAAGRANAGARRSTWGYKTLTTEGAKREPAESDFGIPLAVPRGGGTTMEPIAHTTNRREPAAGTTGCNNMLAMSADSRNTYLYWSILTLRWRSDVGLPSPKCACPKGLA